MATSFINDQVLISRLLEAVRLDGEHLAVTGDSEPRDQMANIRLRRSLDMLDQWLRSRSPASVRSTEIFDVLCDLDLYTHVWVYALTAVTDFSVNSMDEIPKYILWMEKFMSGFNVNLITLVANKFHGLMYKFTHKILSFNNRALSTIAAHCLYKALTHHHIPGLTPIHSSFVTLCHHGECFLLAKEIIETDFVKVSSSFGATVVTSPQFHFFSGLILHRVGQYDRANEYFIVALLSPLPRSRFRSLITQKYFLNAMMCKVPRDKDHSDSITNSDINNIDKDDTINSPTNANSTNSSNPIKKTPNIDHSHVNINEHNTEQTTDIETGYHNHTALHKTILRRLGNLSGGSNVALSGLGGPANVESAVAVGAGEVHNAITLCCALYGFFTRDQPVAFQSILDSEKRDIQSRLMAVTEAATTTTTTATATATATAKAGEIPNSELNNFISSAFVTPDSNWNMACLAGRWLKDTRLINLASVYTTVTLADLGLSEIDIDEPESVEEEHHEGGESSALSPLIGDRVAGLIWRDQLVGKISQNAIVGDYLTMTRCADQFDLNKAVQGLNDQLIKITHLVKDMSKADDELTTSLGFGDRHGLGSQSNHNNNINNINNINNGDSNTSNLTPGSNGNANGKPQRGKSTVGQMVDFVIFGAGTGVGGFGEEESGKNYTDAGTSPNLARNGSRGSNSQEILADNVPLARLARNRALAGSGSGIGIGIVSENSNSTSDNIGFSSYDKIGVDTNENGVGSHNHVDDLMYYDEDDDEDDGADYYEEEEEEEEDVNSGTISRVSRASSTNADSASAEGEGEYDEMEM